MKANSAIGPLFLGVVLSLVLGFGTVSSAKTAEGPFNLVASDNGRYVQLNWDSDFGTSIRGYNIYRSAKVPDNWERLNEGEFTSTTFVDFSAPRLELIFYRVNIVDESGEEMPSASVVGISTSVLVAQPDLTATYNKNNIITDAQLINAAAMNAAQIQSFLNSQGSVLANYSSGGKSAAQRIYDECQTHGISPYVVLVTLQKEKGLIKSSTANPNSFAMGWNTGDSNTSDFANQIYYGTRQFRRYRDNLGSYGWTVGRAHPVSDGTVSASNTSSAGLYIYTPWIGQGGGGQTGVGGNFLFWDLWFNTFAFETLPAAATVDGFDYPVGRPNASGYGITGWRFLEWTGSVYHPAEDWNGNGGGDSDLGDPVYATANGTVVASGNFGSGWGNIILVRHDLASGGNVWSQYAHLQNILVPSGSVTRGQQIGTIGKGYNNEYSAHLHFEIRKINLAANAWVTGFSQTQVQERYYNPSVFINANRPSACAFSVGQGTNNTELTAFQNAFNISGGRSVLGCATASVRFDGFTSFAGTVSHYQTFANGDIEYLTNGSRAGQAFAVLTPFENKWASFGFNNNNPLGYPIGVTSQPANSCYGTQNRYQSFEGGSLNQHLSGAKNGQVFEVHGAIHRRWELGGFAICPLGMPMSDETTAQPSGATGSSGRLSQFEGGQIYWKTNASAAYEVHGAIYSTYVALGGSAGWLGFPVSNEYVTNGRPRSDFEGGYITTLDGVNYQAFSYACPSSPTTNPTSGPIGTSVIITGNNFIGVSSVKFTSNVSAQFTVNSNTQITTTVPTGATTGPITISKPGCINAQTNVFTVTSPSISITVTTNPTGRTFTVDGLSYTTSQTFNWQAGSTHSISTTSPQGNPQTRYNWNNWSDGGAISHSVAPTSNTTYTASFATQHFLTMIAGAGGLVSPSSNWFNNGQTVPISASAATGFAFSGWVGSGPGSFTGSINPAGVTMNGPITETASFSPITRILTVASTNPISGVNITVSPNDKSGFGNGTTQFSRTYNNNASVSLTAPPTVGGNSFQKWQRNGSDWSASATTSLAMDSNHTMTAIYVASPTATVQLSNTVYTVGEAESSSRVTVVRLGNTSAAATVNYVTSDGAGLNNCGMINASASSRCDYAAAVGSISFAAGETSKPISIPIVDDSYAEGTERFTISLSNPSGSSLGPQTTATVNINDNEITDGGNPITQTAFFVRQQYIDFLNREPDPSGYAAWQAVINNCPPGDITCDRIHVSSAFFRSPEFQERGYFVYRFYSTGLGRKPDYSEFMPDFARISGFLSASEMEAAKVAFVNDFMSRPTFVTRYNALSNTAYVDLLLSTAGVISVNRSFWIGALGNGTRTRAQVLREIAESAEVHDKYFNQAFVVMQYFGYLRRDPDGLYTNWIAHLDATGDFRSMINGFVNSAEYRLRFGPLSN